MDEENAAAAKLQSVKRGQYARSGASEPSAHGHARRCEESSEGASSSACACGSAPVLALTLAHDLPAAFRRAARAQVKQMRAEENAAASKLQSVKRGKDARDQVRAQREAAAAAAQAAAEAAEAEASARLGAGAKGYIQRKKQKKEREEIAAASTRIQAARRGKEARKEAAALAQRRKDDPVYQAEEYLKQHKLLELFDLLSQKLVSERPSDPRAYLIAELAKLKETKTPSSPMNFFSGQDIETLYSMYDVSGRGLTRTQCMEAFEALGVRVTMPPQSREGELFDKTAFMSLLPKH